MSAEKRRTSVENTEEADDAECWIGPMPSEAAKPKPKKRKGYLSIFLLVFQRELNINILHFVNTKTYSDSY